MKFKGDIIITDPCYICKDDDWSMLDYSDESLMDELGFKNYLVEPTVYGDWSCTTIDRDSSKPIGRFCADAGLVGVFLLKEVLEYNHNFDLHVERKWTATHIKDFDGEVVILYDCDEDEKTVVGNGNINFFTKQGV